MPLTGVLVWVVITMIVVTLLGYGTYRLFKRAAPKAEITKTETPELEIAIEQCNMAPSERERDDCKKEARKTDATKVIAGASVPQTDSVATLPVSKAESKKEAAKPALPASPAKTASKSVVPAKNASQSTSPIARSEAPVAGTCKATIEEFKEAVRNCGGNPETIAKAEKGAEQHAGRPKASDTHSKRQPAKKTEKKEAKVSSAKFWAYITPGANDANPLPCFANMPVSMKPAKCSSMTFVQSDAGESESVWRKRGIARILH